VEGLIPLSELREVIRAKVEGALFYGAMFTFMAPGAADRLDDLQVEFERSLLSAPKWFAGSLARAVGGWTLCWGERLCFEVLAFRAELWCCSASLLVRQAWDAAQLFPGRTFARCSRGLLIELDVPEVFNFPGWSEFIDDAEPVLNNYKAHIRSVIEQRSAASWRRRILDSHGSNLSVVGQTLPLSAAGRLLAEGRMEVLLAADDWEKLRVGLVRIHPRGQSNLCALCGEVSRGVGHLLAVCPVTESARLSFLRDVGTSVGISYSSAPEVGWTTGIFSTCQSIESLCVSVEFASCIARKLRRSQEV